MKTHAGITALLNEAKDRATERFLGQHVNVERVADHIRLTVLVQAELGRWAEYGVRSQDDLYNLRVRCVPGNTLVGEPPLKIEWDFSHTVLRLLVVESEKTS